MDRITRERRTIKYMIEIYCKEHGHAGNSLCSECQSLYDYAMQRVDKCPFKDDKPTCAKCPVHCYKPAMREQVRQVMRFSGPRMALRHPLLTVLHFRDEYVRARREKAALKRERA
ncbi:MAG: nitrous oxide-stimulated promoter family protein [Chloroflexi bacterium]|nr:nitrous oxide-stimulated promoter family protein [Chloroflexota bacterium]